MQETKLFVQVGEGVNERQWKRSKAACAYNSELYLGKEKEKEKEGEVEKA